MNTLIKWLVFRGLKFKKGCLSFAKFIAILGVVIGVAALIVVNAVTTGFQSSIKERLLASNADIIVMRRGGTFYRYDYAERKISELPHVEGVEPFIYIPVMATEKSVSSASAASLRGCVPNKEPTITDIPQKLTLGDWQLFKKTKDGVVIGRILADNLGITVGDRVTLLSPLGRKTPFGIIPRTVSFRVVGIFEVGMYQFDSGLILAHINEVRKKFGLGNSVTGIMVKLDDPENAKEVEKKIEITLGSKYVAKDWISLNKNLFSALKLEKLAMLLILTLIVMVASFNISSLLMMTVNSKARDIAILKTTGAFDRFILKLFVFQGLMIGIIGTVIGEAIGIGISLLGEKYKLISLPPDIYYIDHLPFKLHISDCVFAALIAIVISILATIYPAMNAARTEPAKVLRVGES